MTSLASPSSGRAGDRPILEPSKIGQFVALNGCPQFHKYEFDEVVAQSRRQERDWKEAFEPLSLLLAKDGKYFESEILSILEARVRRVIDHDHINNWEDSKTELREVFEFVRTLDVGDEPILVVHPWFGREIGAWPVTGEADIMLVWATLDGIRIRILDIKAAHEEKTYQQIQVACYTLLCRQFLDGLTLGFDWSLEGGIIHRETAVSGSQPDDFPQFDVDHRELDVRRLLQVGGRFDELWLTDSRDVIYQLGPKCFNCAYKESCFTDSIESGSTALLGLTQGEQRTLAANGIETIHDLASLAYPPDEPRPYEYTGLTPAANEEYERLLNEPGIGERLVRYIQQAQAFLGELAPDHMYAQNTSRRAPWLVGSGDGNLPDDNPSFDADFPYPRRSLIRCYLHVEWDHRRDRIVMLSAYITASRLTDHSGSPVSVSELAESIPDDGPMAQQVEEALLSRFFTRLFDAITEVHDCMEVVTDCPIHFYLYTRQELNVLVDSLKRHRESSIASTARDLLSLRGAINLADTDQAMVSVVKDEVESRIAIPVPNMGLLPVMEYFYPDEDAVPRPAWTYERADGRSIDLRDAFHYRMFDYVVPFERTETGIRLYPKENPAGFYPSRARRGSHIPLEYIWACLEKLTDDWIAAVKDEDDSDRSIAPFRWVDRRERTTRITDEDLRALGSRLAQGVAHIERGIRYRNSRLRKQPIDVSTLSSFSLGRPTFARGCQEYLQVEYSASRRELLHHYGLPVVQRIQRGRSLPMVVENIDQIENGVVQIDGRLLFDQMFDDGDRVAGACRLKGDRGVTGGSWMVMNELDRQGTPVGSSKPHDIERGPGVTIRELDIENRSITLTALQEYQPYDQEFRRRHREWTTDPSDEDDETVCFEENRLYVLDPRSDDLTAQRAFTLLEHAQNNFVCQAIGRLARGELVNPSTNAFSTDGVNKFADWLETSYEPSPNERQREFILENESQFVLLQGPPGTGKTSGALALATLARVYAFQDEGKRLAGIIMGESNKSVNELLADVADAYMATQKGSRAFGNRLSDVKLVRLTSEPPADPHPAVDYIDYHTDTDQLEWVINRLRDQELNPQQGLFDFEESESSSQPHILVFSTPSRLYGLINKLDRGFKESLTPADWLNANASFFDLLVVDEASMMRIPSFTIAGAFIHDDAQVLISGDQRQLPPVQQHDWYAENRRTIQEFSPFLSTLDYFRALNGAVVSGLDQTETVFTGTAALPFYQLHETYRCHTSIASFLNRHVYAKDDIPFQSSKTHTLREPVPSTDAVNTILNPDGPLVLVVHEDRVSQQSNSIEAAITTALTRSINPEDDAGVVTPHNAQRGLLSTRLKSPIAVDTVERFQGGERECIIVSATASDPDFLRAESEFILNPNRLNVAMSRMKRKLVIIASQSVFELIPADVEEYEQAALWKGLYKDLGVIDRSPDWDGRLSAVLDDSHPSDEAVDTSTRVSVYTPNEY